MKREFICTYGKTILLTATVLSILAGYYFFLQILNGVGLEDARNMSLTIGCALGCISFCTTLVWEMRNT